MRLYLPALVFTASTLIAQTRTVPLSHTSYLRFLHSDAHSAFGFDVKPITAAVEALLGPNHLDAINEIDRVWISTNQTDSVVLMMGHFERGATVREIRNAGATPVFLGNSRVLLAGTAAAVDAAVARLNSATVPRLVWVAKQAWQLAAGRDLWAAMAPLDELRQRATWLTGVREFSLGARFGEGVTLDGEVVTNSDARREKLIGEIESLRQAMMLPDGDDRDEATDRGVTLDHAATSVHFTTTVDQIAVPALAVPLLQPFTSLFISKSTSAAPGPAPVATVADEKLRAIQPGSTRNEIMTALGPPHMVTSISGLDVPRETWAYRLSSGKKATFRFDAGIVTVIEK